MTTREMALRELEGHWSFRRVEGGVLVRDAVLVRALLAARAAAEGVRGAMRADEPLDDRPQVNA